MAHSPEVTLFVAAAGYGKSTALEAAKPRDGVVRPARVVLADGVPTRGWLGIDDLPELTDQEQVLLLDALADLPGSARVAAASRGRSPRPSGRGCEGGSTSAVRPTSRSSAPGPTKKGCDHHDRMGI